jgi:hypothetical protein
MITDLSILNHIKHRDQLRKCVEKHPEGRLWQNSAIFAGLRGPEAVELWECNSLAYRLLKGPPEK